MSEPLLIDTRRALQAQYRAHTLRAAPFRREAPNPAPRPAGKRKARDGAEPEERELTRSEMEAAARHRSVAPWLYIAHFIIRARWPPPAPLAPSVDAVPSLEAVSAALRAWAATDVADALAPSAASSPTRRERTAHEDDARSLSGAQPCAALFRRVWRHSGADDALVTLGPHSFVLPPHCAFLLSHAPYLAPLLHARPAAGYALVVADPPWENASARRAHAYDTMAPHELRALPVASLLAAQAYVAVWVTNKEPLVRFAVKSLLPAWGAAHVATALWLKLTATGELVSPIDPERALAGGAPHRPYETLVIGRVGPAPPHVQELEARLLSNRVIASDVGRRHSRKPPLDELFQPLLAALIGGAAPPACLELFARDVRSGWTSWGNEVLLFAERDGNFE